MTETDIDSLMSKGIFPEGEKPLRLIETHISWVIICERFTYKVKKPVHYPFLDFSTIKKRNFYCNRELTLNRRLSGDMYVDVVPIIRLGESLKVGNGAGVLVDYAVRMKTIDENRQMNVLLERNLVAPQDIQSLARKIADFHLTADIVYNPAIIDIQMKFRDLSDEVDFLSSFIPRQLLSVISKGIRFYDAFAQKNEPILLDRLKSGYFRDCHGDLHTRNIFILREPVPFDCIEFNDQFRQIDVLNEVAFLCMDLEALGRLDLSDLFLRTYISFFPCPFSEREKHLFFYYKAYRANVRAKVNSLRARSATNETLKITSISNVRTYLDLMQQYLLRSQQT